MSTVTLSRKEYMQLKKISRTKTKTKSKRKASPYNKFMKKEMAKIKKECPHMEQGKIMKEAAKLWNSRK